MISERTKAALAQSNKKLGGFRGSKLSNEARAIGQRAIAARADARASDLALVIAELQGQGVTSLGALARALTERGIPTSRGLRSWTPVQVSRVLARLSTNELSGN